MSKTSSSLYEMKAGGTATVLILSIVVCLLLQGTWQNPIQGMFVDSESRSKIDQDVYRNRVTSGNLSSYKYVGR